jgi:hypothetical protein
MHEIPVEALLTFAPEPWVKIEHIALLYEHEFIVFEWAKPSAKQLNSFAHKGARRVIYNMFSLYIIPDTE